MARQIPPGYELRPLTDAERARAAEDATFAAWIAQNPPIRRIRQGEPAEPPERTHRQENAVLDATVSENFLRELSRVIDLEMKRAEVIRIAERSRGNGERWAFVPVGPTCAFCLMIATRGADFFQPTIVWHDACDCQPVPASKLPPGYEEKMRAVWEAGLAANPSDPLAGLRSTFSEFLTDGHAVASSVGGQGGQVQGGSNASAPHNVPGLPAFLDDAPGLTWTPDRPDDPYWDARHRVEMVREGANPNYAPGSAYAVNCQRVVFAYELRSRGVDVSALPRGSALEPASFWPRQSSSVSWMDGLRERVNAASIRPALDFDLHQHVRDATSRWDDGDRGIIWLEWDDGNGNSRGRHVFNVERLPGGEIRGVEAQVSGRSWNVLDDYLNGTLKNGSAPFAIVKVNDLDFNDRVERAITWNGKM